MSIDSIGLLAQQSYSQIQNRPKTNISETMPREQAVSFQAMVNENFNSFAKLSPAQILDRIQSARASSQTRSDSINSGNFIGNITDSIKNTVSNHETVARKSLIGKSSLIDLLTATTEAKNVLDATVKVRDKLLEAWDKLQNMSM